MEKETQYRGYTLKPRHQPTWPEKDRYGYWVSKDGVNPMPGACWFKDTDQALKGIDALEMSNGDSDLFWLLMGLAGLDTHYSVGFKEGFVKSMGFPFTVRFAPNTVTVLDHTEPKTEKALSPKDALVLAAILKKRRKPPSGEIYRANERIPHRMEGVQEEE